MKHGEVQGSHEIAAALARFPEHGRSIRRLVEQDETFRELCADYGECLAALARFRNQGAEAGERIEQYTELRADLERELLAAISSFQGPRST